jgi:hypothetical protein
MLFLNKRKLTEGSANIDLIGKSMYLAKKLFLKSLIYNATKWRNNCNLQQKVLGRTNSSTLLTCHLFEVLERNLTELNLSELTLTSFNLI